MPKKSKLMTRGGFGGQQGIPFKTKNGQVVCSIDVGKPISIRALRRVAEGAAAIAKDHYGRALAAGII
jgi:hypothetical protein